MRTYDETERGPLPLADSDWLADAVTGRIDVVSVAAAELANRGQDFDGKWVGHETAYRMAEARVLDSASVAEAIARKVLGVATLETRGTDSADFHDCAAWALKAALIAAYDAGLARGQAARRGRAAREGERSR